MSENEAVAAALRARLEALEEEIDRLMRLASSAKNAETQQRYWNLARDVQSEARKLRNDFHELKSPANRTKRWLWAGWLKRWRGSGDQSGRAESRLSTTGCMNRF